VHPQVAAGSTTVRPLSAEWHPGKRTYLMKSANRTIQPDDTKG
jgi:hypothetical protein